MKSVFQPLFSLLLIILLSVSLIHCSSKKKKPEPPVKEEAKVEKVAEAAPVIVKKAPKGPTWGYSGMIGPDLWSNLDPGFGACKVGKEQSPLNLVWSQPKNKRNVSFKYQSSAYTVIDNGVTIKANMGPGSQMLVGHDTFELKQLHFHSPSEHALSGKHFPLEIHLVHKTSAGHEAVVGILVEEGQANPAIDQLWQGIPKQKFVEQGEPQTMLDPSGFLPDRLTHYFYKGSLTTPPCSEGVQWNVFNTPLQMSAEQISTFKAIYSHNARPLQKSNGRKIENF